MITNITRGHIEVRMKDRIACVPGEMFRAENGKTGFAIWLSQIDYWEPKAKKEPISSADTAAILDDIRSEFSKNGWTLELD
jgi:hypothetical protein